MIFYRAFCLWLSVAVFAATLPLHDASAKPVPGAVTRGALYSDEVFETRVPASQSRSPSSDDGASEVLSSACRDPQHVRYSPRTRGADGQYVYHRYLRQPNGKVFDCRGVGAGPVRRKLPVTQAEICTDCDTSEGRGGPAQSLQEIAAAAATARAAAPSCPAMRIDRAAFTAGLQCYESIARGIIASLVDLVKGIGYIANAAFTWVRGRFMSRPSVHQTDNAMSKVMNFLRTMDRAKFLRLLAKPFVFIRDLAKAFAINIYETSKTAATCQKWSGIPLASTCERQGPGWDCMSLNQKTQTICSMLGAIGSDIALLFVGGITIGKLIARSPKLLSIANRTRVAAQAATTRASAVVARGGRAAELAVRTAAATARAAGAIPVYSGRTVLRALNAIDKLPGFKQYAQLSERAFLAGFNIGRGGTVRAIGGASVASRTARAADDVAGAETNFTCEELVAMAPPPPPNPRPLQVESEVATQARNRADYRVESISPRKFVARNSTRNVIPEIENTRFRVLMDNPTPGGRTVVIRDTAKKANNTNLSFNRSTAITTTLVERAALKFEGLAQKYEGQVNITRFEGPNRLEVRVDPIGERALPPTIEAELADIYKTTTIEQSDFLKRNRLVRADDNPTEWFKYGSGPDSHTANLTARSNGQFDRQIATHRWEDRATQAQLETVFNRARSLHQTIRDRYKGTEIIDVNGRINPKVAEIVSKSDSPAEAIKKLLFYDDFIKPNGRLIPKTEQMRHAEEIMEYIDHSRSFGIEYYGARTPLALKTDNTVCFGSDLCGQNGRNLSYNTTVFDGEFGDVVRASQDAEAASTREFRGLMDQAIGARTRVLEGSGYRVETASSGDDISTVVRNQDGTPVQELPGDVLYEMSKCTDGLACLRDTYVPARVQVLQNGKTVDLPKQDVIDITHEIEKRTRKKLAEGSRDFDKHNFSIEVSPYGVMRLQISHDPLLPPMQALDLYEKFKRAEAVFSDVVLKTDPAVLRGLRISTPPSPELERLHNVSLNFAGKPAPQGTEYWVQNLDKILSEAKTERGAQIRGLSALLRDNGYTLYRGKMRLPDGRLVQIPPLPEKRIVIPESALETEESLEAYLLAQTSELRMRPAPRSIGQRITDTVDDLRGVRRPPTTDELIENVYDRQGIVTYKLESDDAAGISNSSTLMGINNTQTQDLRPIIIHEVTHSTSSRHLENIARATPEARKVLSGRNMSFISTYGNFDLHPLYKKAYRADEIEARVRELASRRFNNAPQGQTIKGLHEFLDTHRQQLTDILQSQRHRWKITTYKNSPNQIKLQVEGLDYDINIPYVEGETTAEITKYIEEILTKRISAVDKYKERLPPPGSYRLELTPDMEVPLQPMSPSAGAPRSPRSTPITQTTAEVIQPAAVRETAQARQRTNAALDFYDFDDKAGPARRDHIRRIRNRFPTNEALRADIDQSINAIDAMEMSGELDAASDGLRQYLLNMESEVTGAPPRAVKLSSDIEDFRRLEGTRVFYAFQLKRDINLDEARFLASLQGLPPADRAARIDSSTLFTTAEKYKIKLSYEPMSPRQTQEAIMTQGRFRGANATTSASLDKPGENVFAALESRMAKVENNFVFADRIDQSRFFNFRRVAPSALDRAFSLESEPALRQAYIAGRVDPRALVKRDYEVVLEIEKSLGTENLAELNRRFGNVGHVDSVPGSNIFSLRLSPTIEVRGAKIRPNSRPSYRALMCRTIDGKIYVFSYYRKTSAFSEDDFAAFERAEYERARSKAASGAVRCVNPS